MASTTPLPQANTTFSLALLRKLSEDRNSSNLFFSPFSISSALAMVMLGARGNTAKQMSECLKTQDCGNEMNILFAALLKELNKPSDSFTLSVANRLYGEQSFHFLQEFLTELRKDFNSELESVDFRNNHEEARVQINGWVEKQTHDKIKDILAKGIVTNETKLVLVNAIYFKSAWSHPFNQNNTSHADFRLNKRTKTPVQMMKQKKRFPLAFIPEVNCQILEMFYKNNELSMLIFLPRDIEDDTTGLEKLEQHLTYEKFMEWTDSKTMQTQEVNVSLPKFKIEQKFDLKEVLKSMGMVDAFQNSDFSGISGNKDLVLSNVIHQAFVDVDEKETVAAAATMAIVCLGCSMHSETTSFTADHPFLFFIRHNKTMSVLFAGRFCSPV